MNLPTVWNQIEASMAYMLGHPLLVIVEEGMKFEGLLERGYDWYVMKVNLDTNILADPEFQGLISDWKRRVQANQTEMKKIRSREPMQTQQVPQNLLVYLRRILADRFSPAELQMLCFDLDVKYDNLPDEEHALKALHLLQELERTNRIDDLIELGQAIRPDIDWHLP